MDRPVFTNTIQETIELIKTYDSDKETVRIIQDDYLDKMLFGIINQLNYTPDIKMMSGKIVLLMVKYNDTVFIVTLNDTKQNDSDVCTSEEAFELYHKTDEIFYNGLLCPDHMSSYNKITQGDCIHVADGSQVRVLQ